MNKGLRHSASGGPGAPARNAGSALTPLLQRLKLLAAKSSEKQFPVRRDPEFSVARSLVALGGAFLEKESVDRELDLASAHPVEQQDFVRGKRLSVVQATIRPSAVVRSPWKRRAADDSERSIAGRASFAILKRRAM